MNLAVARQFLVALLVGAAAGRRAVSRAMPWVFVAALAVIGAAIVASYVHRSAESHEAHGLTSEMAALTVFLLGARAVTGDPALAVALGAVTSAVLAFVIANTVGKCCVVFALGGGTVRRQLGLATSAVLAGGLATLLLPH